MESRSLRERKPVNYVVDIASPKPERQKKRVAPAKEKENVLAKDKSSKDKEHDHRHDDRVKHATANPHDRDDSATRAPTSDHAVAPAAKDAHDGAKKSTVTASAPASLEQASGQTGKSLRTELPLQAATNSVAPSVRPTSKGKRKKGGQVSPMVAAKAAEASVHDITGDDGDDDLVLPTSSKKRKATPAAATGRKAPKATAPSGEKAAKASHARAAAMAAGPNTPTAPHADATDGQKGLPQGVPAVNCQANSSQPSAANAGSPMVTNASMVAVTDAGTIAVTDAGAIAMTNAEREELTQLRALYDQLQCRFEKMKALKIAEVNDQHKVLTEHVQAAKDLWAQRLKEQERLTQLTSQQAVEETESRAKALQEEVSSLRDALFMMRAENIELQTANVDLRAQLTRAELMLRQYEEARAREGRAPPQPNAAPIIITPPPDAAPMIEAPLPNAATIDAGTIIAAIMDADGLGQATPTPGAATPAGVPAALAPSSTATDETADGMWETGSGATAQEHATGNGSALAGHSVPGRCATDAASPSKEIAEGIGAGNSHAPLVIGDAAMVHDGECAAAGSDSLAYSPASLVPLLPGFQVTELGVCRGYRGARFCHEASQYQFDLYEPVQVPEVYQRVRNQVYYELVSAGTVMFTEEHSCFADSLEVARDAAPALFACILKVVAGLS
eukprot:jgi/Mesvir1/27969/Mv20174-RA.1